MASEILANTVACFRCFFVASIYGLFNHTMLVWRYSNHLPSQRCAPRKILAARPVIRKMRANVCSAREHCMWRSLVNVRVGTLNSLKPRNAYCVTKLSYHWFWLWLAASFQAIIWTNSRLFSIGQWENISVKFKSKYKHFHWRKFLWKCRP